ncbi:YlmH family RNA-binding protein [Ferviditalea candida]|uniref:YlmH/Sll1252 family protein n=1 Tax=Ferviditalea candida TaxID=3108399 RepID=A0ABU5ZDM3_9BACL|nr:YlmH/Sll1252 family protein [Paenibacillaceae bacterium T2]
MSSNIHSHFHPDERPFVDKALEWIEHAAYAHKLRITDFLDPRQAVIVDSLVRRESGAQVRFDGGYEGAERQRAVIAPSYLALEELEADIRLLSIRSEDTRIAQLQHGDFLGALLGLGVKRDKIGDIHVHPEFCHCLAAGEIAEFLHMQMNQVHRVQVTTELLPTDRLQIKQPELEQFGLTVASMRLDGIVSDVYRLSRAKAQIPIKAGKCRVNWKVEEDPSAQLREGDVISLQGFGRCKLIEVEGLSRSGRIRIKVGKYI